MSRKAVAASFLALSLAGFIGIQSHEGTVHKVYLDPVGIPTVCSGHTATVTKKDVGKVVSNAVCQRLLAQDVSVAEQYVQKYVTYPLTQQQYDALVSFTFNVGGTKFKSSTLLRKHNAGNCFGAAAQFSRWVYAGTKVLPGLVERRKDERALYEADCELKTTAPLVSPDQRGHVQSGVAYSTDYGSIPTSRVPWILRRKEQWEV